jgi:hypothetical protein
MSARKPSAGNPQVQVEVDSFTNLVGQALLLYTEHKRNQAQVALMRKALQGFKENRLSVVQLADIPVDKTKDDVLRELDIPLDKLGLGGTAWKYCYRTLGIRFLGELYRFGWRNSGNAVHQEIQRNLRQRGLPTDLDFQEFPWVPEYVNDPKVRAAWNLPIGQAFANSSREAYVKPFANPWAPTHQIADVRYVGELLPYAFDRGPSSDLFKAVTKLRTGKAISDTRAQVWASMVVDNWHAPKEDPLGLAMMRRMEAKATEVREQAQGMRPGKKRTALLFSSLKEERMNPYFFSCLIVFPSLDRLWKQLEIGTVEDLFCSQNWRQMGESWHQGFSEAMKFWGNISLGMNRFAFYELVGFPGSIDSEREYRKLVRE